MKLVSIGSIVTVDDFLDALREKGLDLHIGDKQMEVLNSMRVDPSFCSALVQGSAEEVRKVSSLLFDPVRIVGVEG